MVDEIDYLSVGGTVLVLGLGDIGLDEGTHGEFILLWDFFFNK